ncbi:MAG TPA: SAM-dependent methyltransferase [Burkholderiaceae bacterium]|nr:SAM-dependent methyltransferase [Burkholderiaceae bacterium]
MPPAPQHTLARHTPGTLYLVPTPLDFGCAPEVCAPIAETIPAGTLTVAARLGHWITENAKSTRAFLKRVHMHTPLAQPLQALTITELPREVHKKGDFGPHSPGKVMVESLLHAALTGQDMALVSEAGMPAVADPGALVVRAAHKLGIPVRTLSGPSSLVMALASSGMNGQHFAFVGYLPQDPLDRTARIRELERLAIHSGQTQVFIETPYRNAALFQAVVSALKPTTRLAVACGLALSVGSDPDRLQAYSCQASEWKQTQHRIDWALPCVFSIGT